MPYLADVHSARSGEADVLSWLWVTTRCYSTCGLVPPNTVIRLGTFVQGIASACYNRRGRATLEAWSLFDWDEWHTAACDAIISHSEVDIYPPIPPI